MKWNKIKYSKGKKLELVICAQIPGPHQLGTNGPFIWLLVQVRKSRAGSVLILNRSTSSVNLDSLNAGMLPYYHSKLAEIVCCAGEPGEGNRQALSICHVHPLPSFCPWPTAYQFLTTTRYSTQKWGKDTGIEISRWPWTSHLSDSHSSHLQQGAKEEMGRKGIKSTYFLGL
jgi:hypothetical protein